MTEYKAILATTQLDLHYERMALSALEGMLEQVKTAYIPLMWNHDPRHPPMGRVRRAELVELADGEHGLEGTWELFDEPGDPRGDGRRMVVDVAPELDGWEVRVDRTVRATDPDGDVAFLAQLSGHPAQDRGKKALEPLAELVITVGVFVVGSIALGFFQAIGEDAWHQLRDRLVRRYSAQRDELLELNIGVEAAAGPIQVLIILDEPDPAKVGSALDSRLEGLDELVEYALRREADIVKIVLFWRDERLQLAYAVRSDAVPVLVDRALIPEIESPETQGVEE